MTIQQMFFGSGSSVTFTALVAQLSQTSVSLFAAGVARDGTSIYATGVDTTNRSFTLAKISSTGTLTWQRKLSLTGATDISAGGTKGFSQNCVADTSGNVYFIGWFDTSSSVRETVLVKYNSSGTIQWQRKILGPANISSTGEVIAIDSTGANVFISCIYPRSGSSASAILKYNSSGVIQWQRTLYTGSSNNVQASNITIDSSDNVFVGGSESVSGSFRGFIAKYNSAGTLQWQQYVSYASQANVRYIWIDSSGNLYCGGSPWLMKFNSTGTVQFGYNYSNGNYGTFGMVFDTTTDTIWGNYNNGTDSAFFSQFDSSGNNTSTNQIQLAGSLSGPNSGAGAFGDTGFYLMCAAAFSSSTSTGQIGVWRLPTNMSSTTTTSISLTTWSQLQYITATAASTSAASGLTSGANSMTDDVVTMVDAAGAYTDAAGTLTLSSGTWTN